MFDYEPIVVGLSVVACGDVEKDDGYMVGLDIVSRKLIGKTNDETSPIRRVNDCWCESGSRETPDVRSHRHQRVFPRDIRYDTIQG